MEGCGYAYHARRSRGIVDIITISTGSHRYAEMAFNLAVSAKSAFPNSKFSVITDGNIRANDAFIFDKIIPFTGNPFEAKTRLPELTPYEKTLYLDADTICIPGGPFDALSMRFDGCTFAAFTYGWFGPGEDGGKMKWATIEEIQAISGTKNKVPAYQSSAIFFDNSQRNVDFFNVANRYYKLCRSKITVKGFQPDELAFSIAGSILQHYSDFQIPIAFCDTPGNQTEIMRDYKFISLAGEIIPKKALGIYTNAATTAAKALGVIAHPFDPKAKRMK